jgi:NarL family two-component system response regulator LiaR
MAEGDIRVVIADDHRSFGEALQIALDSEDDLTVIEVVTDGESAIESAQVRHPDVLLMDVQMPGVDGLEATRRIHREVSGTKIILLSGHDDDVVLARAVEAGARGYLRKTQAVADLADAIRRAYRGEPLHAVGEVELSLARFRMQRRTDGELAQRVQRLTPRELEILQRVAAGEASVDIANALGMSRHTLRTHIQNVLTKLGVHSKTDAVIAAIRFGKVRTSDKLSQTDVDAS